MKLRFIRVVASTGVLVLGLAACSPTDGSATTSADVTATTAPDGGAGASDAMTGLPVIDPIDWEGGVVSAGSSTVFPLSEVVAAQWLDEGGPNVTIDSIGSGAGFERFCVAGETDISNASRPIKDEEVVQCQELDRDPIEFRVGTDALVVTVSASNYFATDITLQELAILFAGADTWQEVRADWPAHPVSLFSPGTDSGTFDYFVEEVFDEDKDPILTSGAQFSEDDNVLVQGIANDGCTEGDVATTCAVGFFGFAYFVENDDVLIALSVEAVEPNADNVDQGLYPLARPLFMYSALPIMEEKPQVAAYLTYFLNNVSRLIGEVGYFPAPTAEMRAGIDALQGYWQEGS